MDLPISFDASFSSFGTPPSANEQKDQKAQLSLLYDKYKNKFMSFPKEKSWGNDESLYMYQGFWYESKIRHSIETTMATQETFQARPSDIYLVTIPKSGTTWLKALVFAMVNRNRYKSMPRSSHPLLTSNPHHCVPSVEVEILKTIPTYVDGHSPRIYSTHIPYNSLPQSIIESGCRLIYLYRNPKDVFVSLFHFARQLSVKSHGPLTSEEAFQMFSKGISPHGPYWDHVKGYHKVGQQHPTRILFLTYEKMKSNTTDSVKHLAEFLGCPFTKEEDANGLVEEIVRMCSFESLSDINNDGNYVEGVPNKAFFRKSVVVDWKNHLTDEMSQILDQITEKKFQGLDLSF